MKIVSLIILILVSLDSIASYRENISSLNKTIIQIKVANQKVIDNSSQLKIKEIAKSEKKDNEELVSLLSEIEKSTSSKEADRDI